MLYYAVMSVSSVDSKVLLVLNVSLVVFIWFSLFLVF